MERNVPIPEHLLEHPCIPTGVGTTYLSLVEGYINNTSCVGEYKITVDGVRQYNEAIKAFNEGSK